MQNFWDAIPSKYHSAIGNMCHLINRQKQETLFLEGEIFAGFYIAEKGSFRVFKGNEKGEEATISIVYPGQLISAIPIINHEKLYHADCEALEKSQAFFCPAKHFRDLLLKEPELLMAFSKLVLGFVLNIRKKYLELMLSTSQERFLNFLKKNQKPGIAFSLPVPKKHIAALLDITPESLSRIIKSLQSENKISVKGKNFTILP